jgi:hypothetical protein
MLYPNYRGLLLPANTLSFKDIPYDIMALVRPMGSFYRPDAT